MSYTWEIPTFGEGIYEGKILNWLVDIGDSVTKGEIVAEVQTDKSVEELAVPVSGTVSQLMIEEGDKAWVGDPIMLLNGVENDDNTNKNKSKNKDNCSKKSNYIQKITFVIAI